MKTKTPSFLLCLLLFACSKESDPCPIENYVSIDDNCVCPEGYYELNGEKCIELTADRFIMEPDSCFCENTLVVEITNKNFAYWSDNSEGNFMNIHDYISKPDGDEFGLFVDGWPLLVCEDNRTYDIIINGKFNQERTVMEATLLFTYTDDTEVIVESCTYTMHK